MKKNLTYFLIFLSIIGLFYWRSLFAFFQGDEWYYFTLTLPFVDLWYGPFLYTYKSLAEASSVSSGAHFTPISNFLFFLNVKFFTFFYWPYALGGIIIHALNVLLVFTFVNKLISKQKIIGVIAAVFFAISSIHQQAITWVMTYIWTELSTSFLLLSLIFLINGLRDKEYKRDILYSSLFALVALLAKESTIIIFPLIFLIILFKEKIHPWKFYLKTYGIIFTSYTAYRIFLPKFFNWINSFTGEKPIGASALDLGLIIFRIFTYPLRALTEVFIPAEWIRKWAEFIAPFGYPHYAEDMKISGRNFVVFTQTAGSDIIIYLISGILFSTAIFFIYKSKKEVRRLLILGLAIVVLSALPLILVATYAPWWGYVTFIDSRHLYITSIGGAIFFALAVKYLSNWISKRLKISTLIMLLIILFTWGYFQYVLIQEGLDSQLLTATQRKKVISKVFEVVPSEKDKKVIFVESNQGYYGFSSIPPFQTSLGQILAVYYYQKKQLPQFFINNDFITRGGIKGEGYAEYGGKGFGYFINKKTVFEKIVKKELKLDDLFSFKWDGEKDSIYNKTNEVRAEFKDLLEAAEKVKDWKRYEDTSTGVSFIFPPHMTLSEQIIDSTVVSRIISLKSFQLSLVIEILKVPEGLGFYDVYKTYTDSDGNQLTGINVLGFELDSLHKNTVLMANAGTRPKYFVPTHTEVVSFLVDEVQREDQELIEKIIGSIEYK